VSSKLYVGNIPYQVEKRDLEQLFKSCGTVTNIHIPEDRDTGKRRGFAFVEMNSEEEAQTAINELDGANLNGRNLKVSVATERSSSNNNNSTKKQYAKNIGSGTCSLCNTTTTLYGFDANGPGVCTECIKALSKASRPQRPANENSYGYGTYRGQ
jgi:RNA recognition motif-containing protein